MTKQKNPIFKNKSFSNRAKNTHSVMKNEIKKFKILILKTSPKIGDKAVFFNGCLMAVFC